MYIATRNKLLASHSQLYGFILPKILSINKDNFEIISNGIFFQLFSLGLTWIELYESLKYGRSEELFNIYCVPPEIDTNNLEVRSGIEDKENEESYGTILHHIINVAHSQIKLDDIVLMIAVLRFGGGNFYEKKDSNGYTACSLLAKKTHSYTIFKELNNYLDILYTQFEIINPFVQQDKK